MLRLRPQIVLLTAVAMGGATFLFETLPTGGEAARDTALASVPTPVPRISARGRLRPAGGVTRIAGPGRPAAVVDVVLVEEGDRVAAGQPVAVLDGTAAQRALVERLAAEAQHAAADLRRMEQLFRDGIVSAVERDGLQLRYAVAHAEQSRAQAELDASTVRSPISGRVLAIHTRAGERVGSAGILEVGNTEQMEVVAEVYETDVSGVWATQPAVISATALPVALTGVVERIGLTIARQRVFDINPASDTDSRIVEVHIRLDDSSQAAGFTHLQVDVELLG